MLLKLDFRDEFKLEESPDCRYDFLEVRDGQHGYSNLLGNFCGTNFPPEITSKTRYLWLRFHSDDSIEAKGFKAVWSMIPRPTYRKSTKLPTVRPRTSPSRTDGYVRDVDLLRKFATPRNSTNNDHTTSRRRRSRGIYKNIAHGIRNS